jgi:hypothetical protein
MTSSSFGSSRSRRREKANLDNQTQRQLGVQAIHDGIAAGNTPRQALNLLASTIPAWIDEIPARKAQRRDAWNAFLREIQTASKP